MPPRSRATRNQDAATRSRQGQVIDLDPTDGLPVQKYALMKVTLNQDASTDAAATNTKSTNSAEWAAQFNTPQFPWSEPPVPSFSKELPVWNQELIRRARAGNTNAKLSVWDRKNNCWMSAAEAENKATPLKSLHLNNLDASTDTNDKLANGDADSQKSGEDSDAGDSSNDSNKSADEDEEDADESAPFKTSSNKRRKLASRLNGPDETRLIEVKKWVQLPSTIADRTPDRSFLAPRRPGMPPLYNLEYAQKVFGQYHSSALIGGSASYDLGEGGGLNSATAAIGGGQEANAGTSTPQRKNIPPRRKKKKLGGPGRKPKNWQANQATQLDGAGSAKPAGAAGGEDASGAMEGVEITGAGNTEGGVKTEAGEGEGEGDGEGDDNDNDNDNENESGSEAEGSEEGEIDETGGATNAESRILYQPDHSPVPTPAPLTKQDSASLISIIGDPETNIPAVAIHNDPPGVRAEASASAEPPTAVTSAEVEVTVTVTDTDTDMKDEGATGLVSRTDSLSEEQQHAAPLSAIMNETDATDTPPAAAPAPLPTAATPVEPFTVIPGLGAENPPSTEEQQIIREDVEAITTPSTELEPAVIATGGTSGVLAGAPVVRIDDYGAGQNVKKPVGGEDLGGEDGIEVDLLGAMDEAIDRGMSEGRES